MIKAEFLAELERALSTLPRAEVQRALQFYGKAVEDRKAEGLTEPEAVAALGPVDQLARAVLESAASGGPLRAPGRNPSAARIALLILGSPLWFVMIVLGMCAWFAWMALLGALTLLGWCIALAICALAVGLLLGALLAAWGTVVALAVGGVASLAAAPSLLAREPLAGLFRAGLGLFCAGAGALAAPLLPRASRAVRRTARALPPPVIRAMARLSGRAWRLGRSLLTGLKRRYIDGEVR